MNRQDDPKTRRPAARESQKARVARLREEMFTIAPELLAGGALPRRSDGAAHADAAHPARTPREGGS